MNTEISVSSASSVYKGSTTDHFGTNMTILARRFTILCLAMGVFAVGLTMVVQKSDRRGPITTIGLGAPCPEPAGIHCRAAL